MSRPGEENGDVQAQHAYNVKQESVSYGYDPSAYINYASHTTTAPTSLNQPLPGQPPLPPMPPPQASMPPPPAVFAAQVPQIHTWPTPTWQWITPQAAQQLSQQSAHRELAAFQKEMPMRNNFVKRERYNNNNRSNVYQQRGNYHRKNNNNNNNNRRRYDHQAKGQFDQASYYGAAAAAACLANNALGIDWQKSSEALMSRMQNSLAQVNASNAAKQEKSGEQDKKEEMNLHSKKNKQRRPMSQSYPSRPWKKEDAERALKTENEHNKSVRAQSLIIKFPDPELNKEVVRGLHPKIQNIHFQSPSGPRFCFVQMSEDTNIDEAIQELEKVTFGCGTLKVERKSLRDDDNPKPEEIDPYTLYIGNLPESVNVNEVKNKFPTAARVDVGFAQKMRNTRYAFIRYNNVEESIIAYKTAHSLMWDGRSIIVRFRRQRGNACPSGEAKTSPKIKSEAAKVLLNSNTNDAKVNENQPNETKDNKHITPTELNTNESIGNKSSNVTKSIDINQSSCTDSNPIQHSNSSVVSQELVEDDILSPKCAKSTQDDDDFITEIKEEPMDYNEVNELLVEEDDDDEDDEGELYHELEYGHYDDDSAEDMGAYKESGDSPGDKTSDDDTRPDNLDSIFKDLVNTASDIGIHGK